MDLTAFYEGDTVNYTGVSMPPAHGKLLHFASASHAYVKWENGVRPGEIDIVNIYDLQPVTAAQATTVNPHTAVKAAMAAEGEIGVINHLATVSELSEWPDIAADVLAYTAGRIRASASMETPHEQLDSIQFERVLALASRVLLRDAFGELETP